MQNISQTYDDSIFACRIRLHYRCYAVDCLWCGVCCDNLLSRIDSSKRRTTADAAMLLARNNKIKARRPDVIIKQDVMAAVSTTGCSYRGGGVLALFHW